MSDKHKHVTEGEIQRALKKFQDEGGLIRKLPDEVVPRQTLVGSRYGMYESIYETGLGEAGSAEQESA